MTNEFRKILFVNILRQRYEFYHSNFCFDETQKITGLREGAYLLLINNLNAPITFPDVRLRGTHTVLYAGHFKNELHARLANNKWGHYGDYFKEKRLKSSDGQHLVPTDIIYSYNKTMFQPPYGSSNQTIKQPGPERLEEHLHFLFNPYCGSDFSKARENSSTYYVAANQVDLRIREGRLYHKETSKF